VTASHARAPVRAVPTLAGCPEETLHENDSTRVRRVWLPDGGSVICKEVSGPGAVAAADAENGILSRLAGVAGVAQLAEVRQPGAVVLVDDGGHSLATALRSGAFDRARLPLLALRLARIVAAMHARGVVHKDINPANVLLAGPLDEPVLIDFGLATTFAEDRPAFTHHRDLAGTLAYLAPEQTGRTGLAVDHRADLYALGALWYELATGQPPFGDGDELRLLHDILLRVPAPVAVAAPDLPPALSDIVARLLEKEPDRRYQSAEGLVRDLMVLAERPAERFRLGEWDFPLRLTPPSRLVGRDREVEALRTALAGALAGASRGVLVAGAPGVGKSALINELRPEVARRDGWFVTGKSDQFRTDAALGAVLQAVRGIGRLLLAEPDGALAALRDQLLAALGANAGLVAAAMPEFGTVLGTDGVVAGDPAELESRLRQAVVDVLRAVVSTARPVVLVVDDLQWADPTTLGLLDTVLTAPDLPGLLVVGAYRAQEVDPAHPLSPMLDRWQRLGAVPPPLALENLPPGELCMLLAEMLRLDADRAHDLAEAVRGSTGGNPYDTVELVNALRRDEALVLGDRGWTWDSDAIRRHVGRTDVIGLLTDRIARLPATAVELLQTMACLGGEVRLGLLAAAAGLTPAAATEAARPALEDGLLVLDRPAGGADPASAELRFRHDRVLQAGYAGLDADRRSALHLVLARRLAATGGAPVEAAEQYLRTAETVTDPAERRQLAELYRTAADNARRTSSYLTAERYLAAAIACWAGLDGAGQTLLELEIERHAALHSLGRLAEADEVYAAIQARHPDPVVLAAAAGIQLSSLTQRNQHRAAADLGLELLGRLGQPLPADPAAGLPARLAELVAWAATLDLAADLGRPAVADPRVLAVDRMLGRLLPTAFFLGEPALVGWIVLESQRMWAAYGPTPRLAAALSCAGLVAVPVLGDYQVGYTVARHVLAVAEARGYEPDTSVLRHRFALHVLPWNEPLDNAIGEARLAREGLLRGGDLQMASHTSLTLLPAELDSGRSVAAYEVEIEAALAFAARTGNHHNAQTIVPHQDLVRALTGGAEPEPEPAGAVGPNPMATGLGHIYQALGAALFGAGDALAEHSRAAIELRRFVPGYPTALAQLLRSLALADEIRAGRQQAIGSAELAELDGYRDWLAARAAVTPANFAHLHRLVEAERAAATGDVLAALRGYDDAAQAAATRQRHWQRALIAERAAGFLTSQAMPHAARQHLIEAARAYRSWGATAKVRQLESAHPYLRTADRGTEPAGTSSARRTTVVRAETIDMLSILRATEALSSEINLDRLHTAIVEQLSTLTGAHDVLVALRNDDTSEWFLLTRGVAARAVPVEQAGADGLLPIVAFRYAERTREPLLVDDAVADDRFARDRYLAGLHRCSLLVVPLLRQGTVRAVLMLAARETSGAFTADRVDTVMLISGPLVVSLGNAMLYGSLEERVADRTEALAAANRQLELLSITDALTELPNRRRFTQALAAEWDRARRTQRSLATLMIDVDYFKRYNDHYGHLAGDDCLRRVAAALAGAARSGTDLVARYGGEEFACVLAETDAPAAEVFAERARAAVATMRLPHLPSDTGFVTVSIGAATVVPEPTHTAEGLLAAADAALYDAKAGGRNTIRLGRY
jgi:diguanylate cyclase (GGDEF)-like protein